MPKKLLYGFSPLEFFLNQKKYTELQEFYVKECWNKTTGIVSGVTAAETSSISTYDCMIILLNKCKYCI